MTLGLTFLTLWCLLSLVIARAPEDVDPFCTDTPPSESRLEPALLPSHAATLLDSYNYISLLGDEGTGAVWQQVDLDNNNEAGRGTEVSTHVILS